MLTNKQINGVEAMIANPNATYQQLADAVGVNRNTITKWKRNQEYMDYYHNRLQEVWKESEGLAINSMIELAKDKDFKASKYILDSLGYAPAQKIEADVNNNIVINVGEE